MLLVVGSWLLRRCSSGLSTDTAKPKSQMSACSFPSSCSARAALLESWICSRHLVRLLQNLGGKEGTHGQEASHSTFGQTLACHFLV